MLMDKNEEKEALKALLKVLSQESNEDDDEVGEYVANRRETSVSPEEVEGDLYDEEDDVKSDAEETQEDQEEEGEMGLRELVASFMNEKEDPFSEKKGMPMGGGGRSLEIEMTTEKPLAVLAKKAMKKKRRK